jgi:predicted KAP-like P-loop ATPase
MLIPDHETEVDYLNCEAISKTVVELLKINRKQPITVGIHGDWGAGKSSILKMIESELKPNKEVAVLWFNGWTFEGFDDAKTVLIENTITELCRQRSTIGKVKEKATALLKRVNWLKLAKKSSGIAFNLLTGLPSPSQIEEALVFLRGLGQNFSSINPTEVPAKLDEIAGFLKPAEGESLPETIHQFREEFRELLNEAKVEQLVVLIDDLDRCLPNTAIETLEAIRLFLFVPKTAFIIGADEGMIEYAVRQHFPELPVASGPLPYARNYLEKLIQVPFRIPALGAQETRIYVILLLVQSIVGDEHDGFKELLSKAREALIKPWIGTGLSQDDIQKVDEKALPALNSAFVLSQQIAPILAEGTKGNPRQIKRFLNALLVRQVIAKARGFADLISQPVLAKLMLAERFQPDFYNHISSQSMSAVDGASADLAYLESNRNPDKNPITAEPGETNGSSDKEKLNHQEIHKWLERDWLNRWLEIEPKIGTIDLRPYVFVAREKRFVSTSGQDELEILLAKLCGNNLELRAVEREVKMMKSPEAGTVFNELRERVLRVGNFKNPPPGITGLSIIAKHHPHFQHELVKLIGSLNSKEIGLWAVKGWNESITEPQARKDLIEVMRSWTSQEDNALLKQAATAAIPTLEQG